MSKAISSQPNLPYASHDGWRMLLPILGPLVGLVAVSAVFAALSPRTFITVSNFEIILLQTAVVGTAALGMTLIIMSGGIDLSAGSTIALCTVVIALLLDRGAPAPIAAAAGVATGAACGLIIGLIVTQLGLLPFIVTLGTLGAYRGVAKWLAGETMVPAPTTWLNDLLRSLAPGQGWMLVPPGVWVMLVMAAAMILLLRYTRAGRHAIAVGSNEQTARLCGVHVERTRIIVYVVGSGLAGIAGVLQFSYLTVGDPTTATGMELDIIAAAVIGGASLSGGRGSIPGTLIGALFMTVIANGCTKVGLPNYVQEIVTGGIIIGAVSLDRWRQKHT